MTDEKRILMPESLTAENGAKGLMSGEFEVVTELSCCDEGDCLLCGGGGTYDQQYTIPWTTIKEIYAMAVNHLSKKQSDIQEEINKAITDSDDLIESVKNTIVGILNTDQEHHDDMAEFCLQAIDKAVEKKINDVLDEVIYLSDKKNNEAGFTLNNLRLIVHKLKQKNTGE